MVYEKIQVLCVPRIKEIINPGPRNISQLKPILFPVCFLCTCMMLIFLIYPCTSSSKDYYQV